MNLLLHLNFPPLQEARAIFLKFLDRINGINRMMKPWVLGVSSFVLLAAPAQADPATSIPAIARLCGIRVGWDTMTALETRLGPGLAYTGGHPLGARGWRCPALGLLINADGFYYRDRGRDQDRVVDDLSICRLAGYREDLKFPLAHLLPSQALFMGVVSPGMTRAEVRAALGSSLPAPQVEGDQWIWNAPGFTRINVLNHVVVRSWQARLTFQHGKLDDIDLRADADEP